MANQEYPDILKQGVDVWNQWREEHSDIMPNLSKENFSGARFDGANLSGVDLSEAYFNQAHLIRANLHGANLRGACFTQANLHGADLSGANLRGANLFGAELDEAILSGADLRFANLRGADLIIADLSGADLYQANLEGARLIQARLIEAHVLSADLRSANLSRANLRGADLSGADLRGAILAGTNLENASLTNCSIYGVAVWDVHLEGARQDNLVITPPNQPTITVDNLEVAQFVYLLLNHKKLRDVLNAVTERGVLILGRFGGGGLEVLQAIAAKLREENYLPIIFDFARPETRNYTETVKTLAGLARFIIADLSGPSVPQELYATVPHFKIPFVPIIEESRKPYSMVVDILEYPWVVRPPITFVTIEKLLEELPAKVIAPAEEKHQARQKLLDELFNKP